MAGIDHARHVAQWRFDDTQGDVSFPLTLSDIAYGDGVTPTRYRYVYSKSPEDTSGRNKFFSGIMIALPLSLFAWAGIVMTIFALR